MAYERLDKTYKDGQVWDGAAVTRIDDAIEALDKVLNVRQYDIIKHRQSTNLFDKNTYEFDNDFYVANGNNDKRLQYCDDAGHFNGSSKKMYPNLVNHVTLTPGMFIDGMAARVPLYKYDPDVTSIGWYWCSDDIILMIDTHNTVNKDIVLPDYMNNMRIEVLDKTDSCNVVQSYIFNNKLRFQCTDYGYAVLRLYK